MSTATTHLPPHALGVAELGRAYAGGALDPVAVTESLLDAIGQGDRSIGAFVLLDREVALRDAIASRQRHREGRALGPLDGVPVSVKDLIDVQGWPTRRGSRATADEPPAARDAPAAALLRHAGAVLYGKTSTTEFGWTIRGDNPHTGTTHHPEDPARTPGGSSSGAAAHVAMGWGPLAVGSDAGGSVRIPASYCGIVGFKPSFGAIPVAPQSAFGEFAHLGPLARTVADCAAAHRVLSRPDPRDPASLYRRAGEVRPWRELRIGWCTRLGPDAGLEPGIEERFQALLPRLARLGFQAQEVRLDDIDVADDMWNLWASRVFESFAAWPAGRREQLDPGLQALWRRGGDLGMEALAQSRSRLRAAAGRLAEVFARVDLLLTPATPTVAPASTELTAPLHPRREAVEASGNWFAASGYAFPFNVTQQPALSLPLGRLPRAGARADGRPRPAAGLPFGLQIVGRRFHDEEVLAFAQVVESLLAGDAPRDLS